jgi:hypothetical protein
MKGRPIAMLAGLAAVVFAAAGGIAYASIPDAGGTYHACLKQNGTIRIIDPAADACNTANETEITFDKQGPQGEPGAPGAAGTGPTVQQLAAGNAHCPTGGAAITDAGGSTADVCSGQSFSGAFTSPNGQYGISVLDTGVTITGPGGTHINLSGTNLTVQSDGDLTIQGAGDLKVLAGGTGLVKANSTLNLQGSIVNIN